MERSITIPMEYIQGSKIRKFARLAEMELSKAICTAIGLWMNAVNTDDGAINEEVIMDAVPDVDSGKVYAAASAAELVADGLLVRWMEYSSEKREAGERSRKIREQNRIRKQRQRDRERCGKVEKDVENQNFPHISFSDIVTRDTTNQVFSSGDNMNNNIYNTTGGDSYNKYLFTDSNAHEKTELLKTVETVENSLFECYSPRTIADTPVLAFDEESEEMKYFKLGSLKKVESVDAQCRYLAKTLIPPFGGRKATPHDTVEVFRAVRGKGDTIDQDKVGLLAYAISQAGRSGRGGDWRYIDGILRNLERRGLRTIQEAARYERS